MGISFDVTALIQCESEDAVSFIPNGSSRSVPDRQVLGRRPVLRTTDVLFRDHRGNCISPPSLNYYVKEILPKRANPAFDYSRLIGIFVL